MVEPRPSDPVLNQRRSLDQLRGDPTRRPRFLRALVERATRPRNGYLRLACYQYIEIIAAHIDLEDGYEDFFSQTLREVPEAWLANLT